MDDKAAGGASLDPDVDPNVDPNVLASEDTSASLARRVAVLEKIVALERRLRSIGQSVYPPVSATPAPLLVPVQAQVQTAVDDDLTVLHATVPVLAHPGDEDSTILARPSQLAPS